MALLAGPKRKQKLGLDPNNTNWAKDTSAFGQSLLKKMGWKEGAGLGANENGIIVPIKASMKSDNRGLGCTAQQADAWIAHQEEFDEILAALNGSSKTDVDANNPVQDETVSSTKDKMTEGQKRFYGRYSRGGVKQLRTTEDLDCILGRRKSSGKPTEETKKKDEDSTKTGDSEEKDEATNKDHGIVTLTSSCSVQDYFAQKMKNKKLPPILQNKNKKESSEVAQDGEEQTKHKESFTSGGCTVQDYFAQKMRAKKAKQAAAAVSEEVKGNSDTGVESGGKENIIEMNGNESVISIQEDTDTTNTKKTKKKKKSKSHRECEEPKDVMNLTSDVEMVKIQPCEEKKTKKRKVEDIGSDSDDVRITTEADSGTGPKGNKKLKLDEANIVKKEDLESQKKKKKKKKKKQKQNGNIDKEAQNNSSVEDESENASEVEKKDGNDSDEKKKAKEGKAKSTFKKNEAIKVVDCNNKPESSNLSAKDKKKERYMAKKEMLKRLEQLSEFNIDNLSDELKPFYHTHFFDQLRIDLNSNLKEKQADLQMLGKGDMENGKKKKKIKKINEKIVKLKQSAVDKADEILSQKNSDLTSLGEKWCKKLRQKRKRNVFLTKEISAGEKGGNIDFPKHLELQEAACNASVSQVKNYLQQTKVHLDKILAVFKKSVEAEKLDSTPSNMFPGAIEVKGY